MKRLFIVIITFFLCTNLFSQQPVKFNIPDRKKITKALTGRNEGMYGRLMDRLKANDTTLTIQDYHLLYYGSALQTAYNPMKSTPLQDSLFRVFSKAQSGRADYKEVKSIAWQVLDELPFDIRTLDPAIYACRMLNDDGTAEKLEVRMGRIIETIFTSGDGLTEQTPFYITSTSNDADMIRALGFTPAGNTPQQSGNLRYWKVKENEFEILGFYFLVF